MSAFKIDEAMMREVVGAALLKHIDQDARDTLIMGAIQHLLTPEWHPGSHSEPSSRLNAIFSDAVSKAAAGMAAEMLRAEPAKAKLKEVADRALQNFLAFDTQKLAKAVADAIESSLRDVDWNR